MKKILLFSIASLLSAFPNFVSAQIPGELEINNSQMNQQQQQQVTELSENELRGLLSTACDNSSTRNTGVVARKIANEVNTSLSTEKLNELTKTAIEIKELPIKEKLALCQN